MSWLFKFLHFLKENEAEIDIFERISTLRLWHDEIMPNNRKKSSLTEILTEGKIANDPGNIRL